MTTASTCETNNTEKSRIELDNWFIEPYHQTGVALESGKTLFCKQSDFQEVKVLETLAYGKLLTLDGCVMTTDKDEFVYHEMISHIPMLSHPNPKKVLVIGGGDGGTVREILKHPCVEEVVLCEIDGMVIDACKEYFPAIASEMVNENPKLKIHVADGVAFLADKQNEYDVILIDSSDPIGIGEGLFNRAFYKTAFDALKPDGILTAQTDGTFPEHSTIARVYPIFKELFPIVNCYHGHIPTYPGGLWTWSFCSKQYQPKVADQSRYEKIAATCKYYNQDIHTGAFLLPQFLRNLV